MYNVLVTNDDGIESPTLKELVKGLAKLATVYVAAPAEQQSAKGRSISPLGDISVTEVEMEGAEVAYAVNGTPTDCVVWALSMFEEFKHFDYVFSGINVGLNVSMVALYSGTVGAALEGAAHGIHSIALSSGDLNHHSDYQDYVINMLPELMEMSARLDPRTILSVNAPNLPARNIKGVRIIGSAGYDNCDMPRMEQNEDGNYSFTFLTPPVDPGDLSNDYACVVNGYVAVTPISAPMHDEGALALLDGLAVDKTICVFIDVQEKVVEAVRKSGKFVNNIGRWAACVSRLDLPALIVENYGSGKTITELTDRLDDFETVAKDNYSAWLTKSFKELMKVSSVKRVIIAGAKTEKCVRLTAEDFIREGFEVTILEDCCASGSANDHRVAIDNLRAAGCQIETLASVTSKIMGGSHHPAFKSINEILQK